MESAGSTIGWLLSGHCGKVTIKPNESPQRFVGPRTCCTMFGWRKHVIGASSFGDLPSPLQGRWRHLRWRRGAEALSGITGSFPAVYQIASNSENAVFDCEDGCFNSFQRITANRQECSICNPYVVGALSRRSRGVVTRGKPCLCQRQCVQCSFGNGSEISSQLHMHSASQLTLEDQLIVGSVDFQTVHRFRVRLCTAA